MMKDFREENDKQMEKLKDLTDWGVRSFNSNFFPLPKSLTQIQPYEIETLPPPIEPLFWSQTSRADEWMLVV